MKKTLIIKTGATGDVIRTTVLLHILEGEIYWLTNPYNVDILPQKIKATQLQIITDLNDPAIVANHFDLVINLEEDPAIAQLVNQVNKDKLIGVFDVNGKLNYTSEASYWFDMSLISIHGHSKADELKKTNKLSYQEILFGMLGKKFNGERYLLRDFGSVISKKDQLIGLERNAGSRWPNKKWFGYEELDNHLQEEGLRTAFFQKKQSLADYISAIRECTYIVTGDTLAMHIALACEIPCTALFTCTSPDEIYDYGILKKIVSRKLDQYYYKTESIPEATQAISIEEVLNSIPKISGSSRIKKTT